MQFFKDLQTKLKDLPTDATTLQQICTFLEQQRGKDKTAIDNDVKYVGDTKLTQLPRLSTPSQIVDSLRNVLDIFDDDQLSTLISNFDSSDDAQDRNSIAHSMIQRALDLSVQSGLTLKIGSLLIIRVTTTRSPYIGFEASGNQLCFYTEIEHVLQPGQLLNLPIECDTDFPTTPSNILYHLDEEQPTYLQLNLF